MIAIIDTLRNSILSDFNFTRGDAYYDKFQFEAGGINDQILDRFYIRFQKDNTVGVVNGKTLSDAVTITYKLRLVFQHKEGDTFEKCMEMLSYLQLKSTEVSTVSWDSDFISQSENKIPAKKDMKLGMLDFIINEEFQPSACPPC